MRGSLGARGCFPSYVLDFAPAGRRDGLGWELLRISEEGLEIASTCTIAQLDALSMPPDWNAAHLVRRCCRSFLASFKIWNVATVGGNVCGCCCRRAR